MAPASQGRSPSQSGCGLPSRCASALPRSAEKARAPRLLLSSLPYGFIKIYFGVLAELCGRGEAAMRRAQVGRGVTSTAPGAGQVLPLAHRCSGALCPLCAAPGTAPRPKEGVSLAGESDPPRAERSRGETPFSFLSLHS